MIAKFCSLAAVTLISAFSATIGGSAPTELRISGSTTTNSALVSPAKEAVEKAIGQKLFIVANSTGKGIVDLASGECDVAMVSEPLDIAISAATATKKEIKTDAMKFHQVGTQEIKFVVHPSNTVTKLTQAQIKDIYLGKITNWKDVGGADLPIVVFADSPTGGTRAFIKAKVLGGESYSDKVRAVEAVKRLPTSVADNPGGFAGMGVNWIDAKTLKTVETDKLERPLAFVTFGEPSENVKKAIDAFKVEFEKSAKK